jgi:transposase-like protein
MQCPECGSTEINKNGRRKGKQNYLCRYCRRQFIDTYDSKGYPSEVKEHCLTLYCNGMGFRGIERATGVCHNTVINWVKQAQQAIPDENYEIPETAQLDELQTFVGSKKTTLAKLAGVAEIPDQQGNQLENVESVVVQLYGGDAG